MYKILPLLFIIFFNWEVCPAQNFTGQWKGDFVENSSSNVNWGGYQSDYVLELNMNGNRVSGYSYTYYTANGKKFYTICKVTGKADRKRKYVEVREIERTKTNVPLDITNCFQVHKLYYTVQNGIEMLKGVWLPAPNQTGNCGHGTTELARRTLKQAFPGLQALSKPQKNNVATNQPQKTKPGGRTPVVTKNVIKPKENHANKPISTNIANNKNLTKPEPVPLDTITKKAPELALVNKQNGLDTKHYFEKRNSSVIRTIPVENAKIKVDLYDNGEIDGDTVSVFFNDKLILPHQKLTDKPLSLEVEVNPGDNASNELVMYADNLGSIPPNTALMIVTDGTKRYEVRISSDLQKSGAVRFVYQGNKP